MWERSFKFGRDVTAGIRMRLKIELQALATIINDTGAVDKRAFLLFLLKQDQRPIVCFQQQINCILSSFLLKTRGPKLVPPRGVVIFLVIKHKSLIIGQFESRQNFRALASKWRI